MFRWLFTGVAALLALFFWYTVFVEPMISTTAPTLAAIFFSIVAYLLWPNRSKLQTR